MKRRAQLVAVVVAVIAGARVTGQRGQEAPAGPRAIAPKDFTGYWVSVVTEDWRWRMVTPAKGDVDSVPLNAEGRRVANAWDPQRDETAGESCRAYAAPAIMRVPGRVRIAWDDDTTLRLDTEAGTQTRRLRFAVMNRGPAGGPPAGDPTFFGMAYDEAPVYHDPPSNTWFGFQAWSMERVAEYYYATGNAQAKALLDKWVPWVVANATVNPDGTIKVPSSLTWMGQPAGNFSGTGVPPANPSLHVTIASYSQDLGVAGATAKALSYYAAKSGNTAAKSSAKALLDAFWNSNYQDAKGVSAVEARGDYTRFADPVFVPSGFTGKMPNGDPINATSTFSSIRSWYQNDPDWPKIQALLSNGTIPTFRYHRFWAQSDVATAEAIYGMLFPTG